MRRPPVAFSPSVVRLAVFGTLIFVAVVAANEYWDVPARLLGAIATPARHHEVLLEGAAALALAAAVVAVMRHVHARIRHLSRMLTMCAWCRKVSMSGTWLTIDQFLARRDDLKPSTSLCPQCYARLRPPDA